MSFKPISNDPQELNIVESARGVTSILNSPTLSLGIGGSFVGLYENIEEYSQVTFIVVDLGVGEEATLYFDLSLDQINNRTKTILIGENHSGAHTLTVISQYFRIRVDANQGTTYNAKIQVNYHKNQSGHLRSTLGEAIDNTNDCELTRAVITANSTTNGYQNIQANSVGQLKVTTPSGYNMVGYRFGMNPAFDTWAMTSQREDIDNSQFWANTGAIPINGVNLTFPTVVGTLSFCSSSTLDTAGGTGAQSIYVQGLDELYAPVIDVIDLNGQTPVLSNITLWRVQSIWVKGVGSTGFNQGIITCSQNGEVYDVSGLPTQTVYHTVDVQKNFSHPANWTIPANCVACLTHWKVATDAASNKPMENRLYVHAVGLGFPAFEVTRIIFFGTQNFTGDATLIFPEKTDIYVESQSTTASTITRCTAWLSWAIRDLSIEA
jgi:hypothetical protein